MSLDDHKDYLAAWLEEAVVLIDENMNYDHYADMLVEAHERITELEAEKNILIECGIAQIEENEALKKALVRHKTHTVECVAGLLAGMDCICGYALITGEKKLSAREEYLSHLTPAERLHEDGLSDKGDKNEKD